MCRGAATICWLALMAAAATAQTPLRARTVASGFSAPVLFVQDPTDRAVQFVVEQGGRIRVVRERRRPSAPTSSICAAQIVIGRRAGPARPGVRARRHSGRVLRQLHQPAGQHRRRAVPAIARTRSSPIRRRGSICAGAAATAVHRPAVRQSQRRQPRVRTGRLSLHRARRRRIGRRSGPSRAEPGGAARQDAAASTSTCPTAHPDRVSDSGRQSVRRRRSIGARPEIWSFGLRNPWRYSFDDPARGGTGALIIGDVGQDAWEESRLRAARARRTQLRLAQPRRRARQRHVAAAGVPAADRSDLTNTTAPPASRSPAASCIAAAALGAAYRGRYFFADYVQGRVWSLALDLITQSGEATRVGCDRAHGGAAAAGALGNISSFGVDADGELYIVSYSKGAVIRITGTGTVPAAPTGLRIIK